MKHVSLNTLPFAQVSHDPQLRKKVLVPQGALPHVRTLSHIVFNAGDSASEHVHADGSEVFFGLKGRVEFEVDGETVTLNKGDCLVIEPGERHSVRGVEDGSEMLYFLAFED